MGSLGETRPDEVWAEAIRASLRVWRFEPSATVIALHLLREESANVTSVGRVTQILAAVDAADILFTVALDKNGGRMRITSTREHPIDFLSHLLTKGLLTGRSSLKSYMVFLQVSDPIPDAVIDNASKPSAHKGERNDDNPS